MKEDVKGAWITALESGDYPQAMGALHRIAITGSKEAFCCLGVLCDLALQAGVTTRRLNPGDNYYTYGSRSGDRSPSVLPYEVVDWAGLSENDPSIGVDSLSYLNDNKRLSFAEIAQHVRDSL